MNSNNIKTSSLISAITIGLATTIMPYNTAKAVPLEDKLWTAITTNNCTTFQDCRITINELGETSQTYFIDSFIQNENRYIISLTPIDNQKPPFTINFEYSNKDKNIKPFSSLTMPHKLDEEDITNLLETTLSMYQNTIEMMRNKYPNFTNEYFNEGCKVNVIENFFPNKPYMLSIVQNRCPNNVIAMPIRLEYNQ